MDDGETRWSLRMKNIQDVARWLNWVRLKQSLPEYVQPLVSQVDVTLMHGMK